MNTKEFNEKFKELTIREHEIMLLVIKGFLNKEIASKMCISIRTVEIHRANAMRTIGTTRVAIITRAYAISKVVDAINDCQKSGIISLTQYSYDRLMKDILPIGE